MEPTLPPIRQSPDDLMALPIADLVYRLDMRIRRIMRWVKLFEKPTSGSEAVLICKYMMRDDALRHAAATALRTRAGEVSQFAASVGVECPAEMVRKAPHLCACALVKHIMGPEYGKDA